LYRYTDVGALVYSLKCIWWKIPDFLVDRYRHQLLALHRRMEARESFCSPARAWPRSRDMPSKARMGFPAFPCTCCNGAISLSPIPGR
jgi:hypothetical protein